MMQFIETLNANLWLKLLIDTTLKSIVIFAVAGLFGLMLRRQSAAVRSLIWGMAIVGCLIVPLFSLTLPQWQMGVLPATPAGFEADLLVEKPPPATPVPIVPRPAPTPTQATPTPSQPPPAASERGLLASLHWTDWMVVGWALVALFLLARLIVGIGAVWYISARSDDFSGAIAPLRLDLKRRCRVRLSDAVTVPMVWGFFRPVILLPADANNWQAKRQRAVLLHELGHIQRRDWLMQTIAQLTCALYWFNPLVWFAARQMRTEAEQACDDHVLNAGYQSTDYAQHLLAIVRNVKAAGAASRAAVAMARQSKIEERLRTVLAENRNRHPVTKVAVAIGLLVLTCFVVPMGVMRLAEAVDEEDALYQEIQTVSSFQPEPLPKNATEAQKTARGEQYQQNEERVVQLCEQFLKAYPKSERYNEVWYEKLSSLRLLKRDAEFDAGVDAFLSERPSSKYVDKLHRRRAYYLESQFKFHEALAEWDKVDDPALLPEAYERQGQIYSRMNNWGKRSEFDLLRAELILGKPAPQFSHTSVDGVPVSLQSLRGKVVVLYHWSTRDGQTMQDDETGVQISALKRLHETHSENPNFVLITVCTQSSEAVLKEFVKTHAMPGIHLLLEHEAVPYQFGVDGWSYYVVLDKAGILRESAPSYAFRDLESEHLVTALLAEDTSAPGARIIPRLTQLRVEVYDGEDQEEKAIVEYEKLLAFMPNNPHIMWEIRHRKFHLALAELYRKRAQTGEAMPFMNQVYERIVEESRVPPEQRIDIRSEALELAAFFSRQGDRKKTWTLFQIAAAPDDDGYNSAINYAREKPERFAAIQDMPEFQKLLADTPQTEADKQEDEANRKREMYAEALSAAHKSFTGVKADDELFTGVILSQVGHILVPASVTEAKVILAKIGDYQSAKVIAVDAESGLGVVQVDGQKYLRPVVLGTVDDLREYVPIPLPNPEDGNTYSTIVEISARGYPFLSPEIHQRAVGHPTMRHVTVAELEIGDDGKVTTFKAAHPGRPGEILRGDALVYYDGRLLAVALENEVRYGHWGPSANPIPINQIRAALERMNIIDLMESRIEKPAKAFELVLEAENFTRLDGVKPKVPPFLTMDDETASGGAYIVANTALDDQYQETETWLTYEIEIPADGDYALWLYGRAFTGKSDSFFVSTDLETRRACDMSSYDKWGAVPAIDRAAPQATPAFNFTKGKHEIRLFVRETGTELDAMFLTNDLTLQANNVAKQFQSSGQSPTR